MLAPAPAARPGSPVPAAARDSARHALNRLAYGPRPGEIDRVAAMGVMRWIDTQLDARQPEPDTLASLLRAFSLLRTSPDELAGLFRRQSRARAAMRPGAAPDPDALAALDSVRKLVRGVAGQLQQATMARAVLSQNQLQEVMADFWFNHFNVFLGKNADRYLTPEFVERTIRPRVFSRFEDLLIATAQSPAMLVYLDNVASVAPGAMPPGLARRGRRGLRADPRLDPLRARLPTGINENYARELLELHSLGVEAGYTQDDVINVARILTGWGIEGPGRGTGFEYHAWAHDTGRKVVMGTVFPAGHGMDEGIRLLKFLAAHPATIHHVSRALCARFVADDPPDGCVDDAARAWRRTDGDIREVLRAIFHGPDFWAAAARGAKIKTPLEFIVSATRAMGGMPDATPRLAQAVTHLGQPLFLQSAPIGYPETQEDWVNSGALLTRMNLAVALAAGRLPGVRIDLAQTAALDSDPGRIVAGLDSAVFGGALSEHTRSVIRRELADVRDPVQARAYAIGLAVGGPEFQRQ